MINNKENLMILFSELENIHNCLDTKLDSIFADFQDIGNLIQEINMEIEKNDK